MWTTGAPFAIGYSCTIANDGELTSRGSAPSSVAMARARNVLPAPRSPIRCTTASRGNARAISRPAASVSASVGQRNVFTDRGSYVHCTGTIPTSAYAAAVTTTGTAFVVRFLITVTV